MRTYYIIKAIATATEQNNNSIDREDTYYLGKGNWYGCDEGEESFNTEFLKYIVDGVGYSRRCDAVRALKKRQELERNMERHGFWKYESEIVEVSYYK